MTGQSTTEKAYEDGLRAAVDQLRNADVYGNVPAGTQWRRAFDAAADVIAADLNVDLPEDES